MDTPTKIIFFDGECMLCNHAVKFIMNKNKNDLYFSELQSSYAEKMLLKHNIVAQNSDTIYFYKNGQLYNRSTAALKIIAEINLYYKITSSIFMLVPRPLRNWVYHLIAKNRYRIFKSNNCLLPTPGQRKMILK